MGDKEENGTRQYHLKVRDQETIESIRYEHQRAGGDPASGRVSSRGSSETATVLALVRDGIRYRRLVRDAIAQVAHRDLRGYSAGDNQENDVSQCVPVQETQGGTQETVVSPATGGGDEQETEGEDDES